MVPLTGKAKKSRHNKEGVATSACGCLAIAPGCRSQQACKRHCKGGKVGYNAAAHLPGSGWMYCRSSCVRLLAPGTRAAGCTPSAIASTCRDSQQTLETCACLRL